MYISKTIPRGKFRFAQYLRTRCFGIKILLVRCMRSLVRFLILQFELVRSYRTSALSINYSIVHHPVKQFQQL